VFYRFRIDGFRELWWFGLGQMIFFAAVMGLIVFLAVRLTNRAADHHPTLPPPLTPPDSALTEARLRYARGELSREDFLRISADLSAPGTNPPPASPPS